MQVWAVTTLPGMGCLESMELVGVTAMVFYYYKQEPNTNCLSLTHYSASQKETVQHGFTLDLDTGTLSTMPSSEQKTGKMYT
jgi:hypothetical protein